MSVTIGNENIDYQKLEDAYWGLGGYLDGSYLVEHKRENTDDLTIRKSISKYKNYFSKCVNALTDPIFAIDPKRNFENEDEIVQIILDDADRTGTEYKNKIQQIAQSAAIYNSVLVVVDSPAFQPESLSEAIDGRTFPYVYSVRPDRITAVFTDYGGEMKAICYTEQIENDSGEAEDYIRVWTKTETFLCSATPSVLADASVIDGTLNTHNLGILPVRFLYTGPKRDGYFVAPPKFLSAAGVADMIYQQTSEIREYQRKHCFPLFGVQGGLLSTVTEDGQKTAKIGNDKAIEYPIDANNAPDYITPDHEGLKRIEEDRAANIAELESLANTSTDLSASASSDTRKMFFKITNQDKSTFANNLEDCEKWIWWIIGKYANKEYKFDVEYDKNFGLDDSLSDSISNAQTFYALFTDYPEVQAEILADLVSVIFPRKTPEEQSYIIDLIVNSAKQNEIDNNANGV